MPAALLARPPTTRGATGGFKPAAGAREPPGAVKHDQKETAPCGPCRHGIKLAAEDRRPRRLAGDGSPAAARAPSGPDGGGGGRSRSTRLGLRDHARSRAIPREFGSTARRNEFASGLPPPHIHALHLSHSVRRRAVPKPGDGKAIPTPIAAAAPPPHTKGRGVNLTLWWVGAIARGRRRGAPPRRSRLGGSRS
jgi:hypothetical protein